MTHQSLHVSRACQRSLEHQSSKGSGGVPKEFPSPKGVRASERSRSRAASAGLQLT